MYTVLITGANRGIGLSFVKGYLEAGWSVIATARKTEEAHELKALQGKQLQIEQLDVADPDSIKSLKNRLSLKPIHILINNAGVFIRDSLGSLDESSISKQFQVNSIGPLLLTQSLLPNLTVDGYLTKIVNITSKFGSIADSSNDYYGYRSSKAALNMFTKLLSNDLKKRHMNVSVVSLHPGYVITDMTAGKGDITSDDSVEKMMKVIGSMQLENSGAFMDRDGHIIPW